MGRAAKLRMQRHAAHQGTTTMLQGVRSREYVSDDGATYLFEEAPSRQWQPMRRIGESHIPDIDPAWQKVVVWRNAWYEVLVRTWRNGFPIGNGPYYVLAISHLSQRAIHDCRDFQAIKSDICGPEWEGVELYPAESRLIDPSNRYYLWCVPKGVLTWGLSVPGRRVFTMRESIAPQRPFPGE